MINTKYDPAPWTEELTPLIGAGDDRVHLNGHPARTACRVIAEENFQYAMSRVNAHDDLVNALTDFVLAHDGIFEMRGGRIDTRDAIVERGERLLQRIRKAVL